MNTTADVKRRVRNGTLLWTAVAAAFYLAFIVMTVYRSRH